ncbi:MAG: hypothetical protein BWY77_01873 [bacterium ADurb.Bin431]|nr:MAG: hypothetical protein BWY77_01873 [bacterium ADurb.Bin431]
MAEHRAIKIDHKAAGGDANGIDDRFDLPVQHRTVDAAATAIAKDRTGSGNIDLGIAAILAQHLNKIHIVSEKFTEKNPVLGLAVVRAQADDDNMGIKILGLQESRFVPIGEIPMPQQGGAADPEIAHIIVRAQPLPELLRPGGRAAAADGDAVADAGDADDPVLAGKCRHPKGCEQNGGEDFFHALLPP